MFISRLIHCVIEFLCKASVLTVSELSSEQGSLRDQRCRTQQWKVIWINDQLC